MLYYAQSHRMPRKLYKNIEDAPQPQERPGAGSPDDSGVRKKPSAGKPKEEFDWDQLKPVGRSFRSESEMYAYYSKHPEEFRAIMEGKETAPASAKEKALSNIKRKRPATSAMQEVVDIMGIPDVEDDAVEEAVQEQKAGDSSMRRVKAKKEKEETLSVEDAQTSLDAIERDLAGMGVTSFADKSNDPEWLKANMALSHARRAARVETGKRGKAEYHEAKSLEAEKADNLKKMKDMGGVWGGEDYFVLSERNEEIDARLNKLKGRSPERKKTTVEEKAEELMPATEESFVMGELTPEDRVADARKAIDFMNAYEQEIAARQKAVRAELKKLGIKDAAQIDAEMEVISPELRQKAIGLDPGLWYKMKRMGRNLMGMERPPEIKGLLEKYAQLENEMNEQLHKRREAEAELMAAHAAAGTTPMRRMISSAQMRSLDRRVNITSPENEGVGLDMSAVGELLPKTPGQLHVEQELESLGHIEQGSLQKELAAVRALRTLEEEIQDSMLNFAGRKQSLDAEDVKMYKEKLEDLHSRLRNLDQSAGKSPEAISALQNVEGAYAQYRRLVNQATAEYESGQAAARAAFDESMKAADAQSKREREAGRSQPMSVIGRREGEYGSYGASKQGRRVVNLGKMETTDTYDRRKSQEQREAEELREKVNKEVQSYRSIKWRKELIDSINQNENVRSVMHSLYDSFKARAIALQNEGADLGPLQTSPDPALDYALNLYRLHATKENGKYVYGDQLRDAAAAALIDAEEVLGDGWDGAGFDQRMQKAIRGATLEKAEDEEVTEIEIENFPGSEELYAKLPADLKEEPEALNFAYRFLNRDEVGSFTREFAVRQIMKRMVVPDKSQAERMYEALRPEEEAAPIPLTRVKRARSEAEVQKEEELDIPITVEMPEEDAPSLQDLAAMNRTEAPAVRSDEDLINMPAPDVKPVIKKRQMQGSKLGFHGESTSEPVVENRPIRSKLGWSPEAKQEEREKPYGPLSQEELAYLKESLNRLVLSKGNEWLTLGPKVKSHFGKGDWIEQYANLYAAYRGGKLDEKNAELTRSELEKVNELLGISKPSELILPPSPELRIRHGAAWQQADERYAQQRKSQKKSPKQTQGQKPAGQVIEYERLQQARAAKQKKKKGA